MREKTKTTVVIESHQQTIIRRSRRTISAPVVTLPAERRAGKTNGWLKAWWRTLALKSATVFAALTRRKRSGSDQAKNRS